MERFEPLGRCGADFSARLVRYARAVRLASAVHRAYAVHFNPWKGGPAMFSIANLLERAKANANLESDYRLSKVLSINQSALGNYKAGRSWPNDKILAQLCALSGDDVALVAAQIQAERSQSPEGKNMWLMVAARLRGGASTAILSVVFAIGLIAGYAEPARASGLNGIKTVCSNLLYIVSSTFLSVPAFLMVRLRLFTAAKMACIYRLSVALMVF